MSNPVVTIVTATTCTDYLKQNIDSVINQTYDNIQHLIVVDGQHHLDKLNYDISSDVIVLPYATGTEQYNGHRIYGAATYLAKGDFIMYLDEDNWLEPNHVESLVNTLKDTPNAYACSLRKITDMDGNFICNDDCESPGKWKSVLNDNFVDVNCFFVRKDLALQISPIWYRQIRQPGVMEVDRALSAVLMNSQNNLKFDTTYEYSVNYRVGSTEFSVRKEFFIEGNKKMNEVYGNNLPWKK